MFFHIYKNRIKCIIRDKELMFWTLIFPFALAILFGLVLTNINKSEEFTKISIAVIESENLNKDIIFKEALDSAKTVLDITYTRLEDADDMLKENKIEGYIIYEDDIKLIVKNIGIKQTILKRFLDEYKQSTSTIFGIISLTQNEALETEENTDKISKVQQIMANEIEFLIDENKNQSFPDLILICFYSLIAMTCFYGGNQSMKEVMTLQADSSAEGARVNMAPVKKCKMLLASMSAVITILILQQILFILFLIYVLKVDFGNNHLFIAITCVTAIFTGALFGAVIGTVLKGNRSFKIGVIMAYTMLMCFLSGMMAPELKYIIEGKVPFLSKINPIALVTDSFYYLYYYSDYSKYAANILILWGMNLIFGLTVYIVIRRQKYASI